MLQINFIMIRIIHQILVLVKINRILKHFLRSIIDFLKVFKKIIIFFSQYIIMENSGLQEEKIKDARNPFRLKNKMYNITIKDIRNIFRIK